MTALHYLPNALCVARLVLGLTFPVVPTDWRLGVVIAAALSDLFDGYLARWLGAESDAGRLLDPVADKVFVFVLAGTLIAEGAIPPLWAVGLAARDITVLVGLVYLIVTRQWAWGRRLRPSPVGKVTTTAQFALLLALVIWAAVPVWAFAAVTLLSAVAAFDYAQRFWRLREPVLSVAPPS